MKKRFFLYYKLILLLFIVINPILSTAQNNYFKDYPINPVNFADVELIDDFWSQKIKINHEVTIPIAIDQSYKTGRIDNFIIAGGLKEGSFCSIYPFDDSDVFKIIEAASYSLQTYPDEHLEMIIDSLIYYICEAQEEDGYLYTNRTIGDEVHPWAGGERWMYVNELSHELYNIGHMYEAAVAHFIATGKRSLLDVAIKSADLVCETFGPGKIENYPGHQEIEIGLIKLYRLTKNTNYLSAAKYFLDIRGNPNVGRPDRYNQSHIPVIKQTEAVGHAVRASYMWTAMADVAAITGNKAYLDAIHALWEDVIYTKYYINGGIGATRSHEGFGRPYELPNMTAYCETCAGVGNAMWNHRMFLMTGDAKYIDVMERTMYNNILTGVSFAGDRFFYPNPLSSSGQHERSEWFGCACCPPNVARFLPSMPGYIYAKRNEDIYINLFVSSTSDFQIEEEKLQITQKSEIPWKGNTSIYLKAEDKVKANLHIRIPGWVQNDPVPGDLYEYTEKDPDSFVIKVNGHIVDKTVNKKGYVVLSDSWQSGDTIDIEINLKPKKIKANPLVVDNNGKIAIEYGPLVYCAEWADNGGSNVLNLVVNEGSTLTTNYNEDLFGGIVTLNMQARHARKTLDEELLISPHDNVTLIPYYLWNNRGPGQMSIWLPTSIYTTNPTPAPTIAFKSTLSCSEGSKSLESIVDQILPTSSGDHTHAFFHWWPKKDSWEWVMFDMDDNTEISQVSIYWFDDRPNGGTRIPDDWKISYYNGKEWKPVNVLEFDEVRMNKLNTIKFKKVLASKVKVEVKLSKDYAAGIHEVIIE